MKRCAEWLVNRCEKAGLKAEVRKTTGCPVVIAKSPKQDPKKPTYLVYGHYDVQPADPLELWTSPPFEPCRVGRNVYARGISDNKGQHLATHAERQRTEAEFQISFKARLWATDDRRLGGWAAYTQQSQWQVYNEDRSRPFRETNYEPELFVSYRPDISFGDFHWRLFNFGYNHQSNGRAEPLSRSWDRLTAEFGLERGDFALLVRPW